MSSQNIIHNIPASLKVKQLTTHVQDLYQNAQEASSLSCIHLEVVSVHGTHGSGLAYEYDLIFCIFSTNHEHSCCPFQVDSVKWHIQIFWI